jgi:SpoVK/Ycf46/Vps4 family AAA+-type ATPase
VDQCHGYVCAQAPQVFTRLCIQPPRGVLLHGPPGSGKTVLACAAAADAGAALFVLNGPDIMSEYHGESEAGLQVTCYFQRPPDVLFSCRG